MFFSLVSFVILNEKKMSDHQPKSRTNALIFKNTTTEIGDVKLKHEVKGGKSDTKPKNEDVNVLEADGGTLKTGNLNFDSSTNQDDGSEGGKQEFNFAGANITGSPLSLGQKSNGSGDLNVTQTVGSTGAPHETGGGFQFPEITLQNALTVAAVGAAVFLYFSRSGSS